MHTNKSDMNTPRSTPEPIRDRFPKEWNQLKSSARATFSKLTDEDVRAVNGRYDELSDRLRKTYNYSQDRIDTEILNFMSGGSGGQGVQGMDRAQQGGFGGQGAQQGGFGGQAPQGTDRAQQGGPSTSKH